MLNLEVFTAVVVYPLLVFLLVEIFVGIIWGEIEMKTITLQVEDVDQIIVNELKDD